eukprot:scaffold3350_cov268-Pinguiococcus_pyrenoidosus.AAC.30
MLGTAHLTAPVGFTGLHSMSIRVRGESAARSSCAVSAKPFSALVSTMTGVAPASRVISG